jgi:protein-S-isoprenylcysteine O-methyltransferase Ste14
MTLWGVWVVSWWGAALWSDRAVTREGLAHEARYRLLATAGVVLLFMDLGKGAPSAAWLRLGSGERWGTVALVAGGLAFTWWGRVYLGRLWSATIGRKAAHRLVDTGPYAVVRHPIYTGVIVAVIATALQRGTVQALAGAALLVASFYVKARMEETFLRGQLDPAAYDAYARRVPMLVPFLRS